MEPTIYKPSIYNGAGIYKVGAGGGGNDKILFYTNFENFDINDNIDTPLIGNSYEVLKESYITLQKKEYCLSFKENQNSNRVNRAFKKIENNKHTRIVLELNPNRLNTAAFFWFSEYIDQSDFGFRSTMISNDEYENLVLIKTSIPNTRYNLTFKQNVDVWDAYTTDFTINENFIVDILDDENNRHVYLNGYKILDLPPKDELYLRPSPVNWERLM